MRAAKSEGRWGSWASRPADGKGRRRALGRTEGRGRSGVGPFRQGRRNVQAGRSSGNIGPPVREAFGPLFRS